MPRLLALLVTLLALSGAARAEVVAASPGGFSLVIETPSRATPARSYEAFVALDQWWDPAHSYSGDADNLTLELVPGGAFLETLPDGGFVKHLEVVYLKPGEEIRLLGGLGPLQPMGLHGALTVRFEAVGSGSKTVMIYNVTGFSGEGLEPLAPVVDAVQAGQMRRHAAYADRLAGQEATPGG